MSLFLTLTAALLVTAHGCPISSLIETSFNQNSSLQSLYLTDCQIAHIPQDVFTPITKLTRLILNRNLITELTKSSLEGLQFLEHLELSENKLSSLPDDFLLSMPLLKRLFINKNPLLEISSNTLSGSNLVYLQIEDNQKPLRLAPRALADMPHLSIIEMQSSGVTALPGDLFDGSNALRKLDLSYNHIQYLPDDIFANKSNLEMLFISNNQLRTLPPTTFASLESLYWLDLENNEISEIEEGTLSTLKLIILNIQKNKLRVISPDAFPAFVLILALDNNMLTSLETKSLPSLSELRLGNNSLSSVPQHWPDTLPDLEIVDLSNNSFTQLSESDMAVLSHYPLTSIILMNNKIETILVGQNTTESPRLLLEGAPLRCDCLMHRFSTLLHKNTNKVKNAYCADPVSLNGTNLAEVPLRDFICHLKPCPVTCKCVVRPETKALEVECREQLTADQVTMLENLRQQRYSGMTRNTTISYITQ